MAGTTRYQKSYACHNCGAVTPRDRLTVKKSVFTTMGSPSKTVKSRVKAWLCPDCLVKDPDWNLEAYVAPDDRDEPPSVPTVGQLNIADA